MNLSDAPDPVPAAAPESTGFLRPLPLDDEVIRFYDEEVAQRGYVMNLSRVWAYQPDTFADLLGLIQRAAQPLGLDARRRAILVAACASEFGSSYCSLVWGSRLADAADPDTAACVIRGDDGGLSPAERTMARWARAVARDPNATTAADVDALREAGFTDAEVFAMTAFVALRLAFAMVNDALGSRPDAQLRTTAPAAVLDTVTFGRPVQDVTNTPAGSPAGPAGP
jgi:alkylhydroperoxidase family enzyme